MGREAVGALVTAKTADSTLPLPRSLIESLGFDLSAGHE